MPHPKTRHWTGYAMREWIGFVRTDVVYRIFAEVVDVDIDRETRSQKVYVEIVRIDRIGIRPAENLQDGELPFTEEDYDEMKDMILENGENEPP